MRFEADPRLLELLVGSNLYPSPDVCVRELVQNAWDAIEWRRNLADGAGGTIVIRLNASQGWFEVVDDGIGMDQHDIEESFLKVGRDKLEALGAASSPGEQVAFFGIGILSVFLVADAVEVSTRKVEAAEGLRFDISGLQGEIAIHDYDREEVGTRVRVRPRPGQGFTVAQVTEAVRKYVRHVDGVSIEDIETGIVTTLGETWDAEGLLQVATVPAAGPIRSGRLGFSSGLRTEGGVLSNAVTLTNAGFLVERRALDLIDLPPTAGVTGELDLHPGQLNVVMARERFQRDEAWAVLGRNLVSWFKEQAHETLESGALARRNELDPPEVRRNLLLWSQTLPDNDTLTELKAELRLRVRSTVPFAVAERRPASLEALIAELPNPRLYFRRSGSAVQRPRHIDDEGFPVQLIEEVRDSIRVGALRARGFPVIETVNVAYTQETPTGAATQQLDEAQVVATALADSGIQVLEIGAALEEDLDLNAVEELPVLRNVLDVGGLLRFARIPESNRRVVTDPSGIHYLNVNNPTVKRVLAALPRAVSNPLRRKLLAAYLGVEDFKLSEARSILLELLEAEDLARLGGTETAVLTSGFIAREVRALFEEATP